MGNLSTVELVEVVQLGWTRGRPTTTSASVLTDTGSDVSGGTHVDDIELEGLTVTDVITRPDV